MSELTPEFHRTAERYGLPVLGAPALTSANASGHRRPTGVHTALPAEGLPAVGKDISDSGIKLQVLRHFEAAPG